MSAGTEPTMEALAAQLAKQWSRRSIGERQAFSASLVTARPADTTIESTINRLRMRAALSGSVAPRSLIYDVNPEIADQVLDALAPEFERALHEEGWRWTLRAASRSRAIAKFAALEDRTEALADAVRVPTDKAGEALRRLIADGHAEWPAFLSGEGGQGQEIATLVQALAWAAPLGGFSGDLAEARLRASLAALHDRYGLLLAQGLIGRRDELGRLNSFARAGRATSDMVPLLPVIGIGGVGKSTLLAAVIRPFLERLLAREPDAPVLVVIDFDRAHFRAGAEVELSFEVLRQLGAAQPEAAADLSVLRHRLREERRSTGADQVGQSTYKEGALRDASLVATEAAMLLRLHGVNERPVVLVLDTFEEWQRNRPDPSTARTLRNDPERRILEWITGLRGSMGLTHLRVIVSGRAKVSAAGGVYIEEPLCVDDLSYEDAECLLRRQGIDAEDALQLARTAGGNPLTLRVAARFYLRLDPAQQTAFLAEPESQLGELDKELRRAVLYERFLEHVDLQVQPLAHPGLALRQVTPNSLRGVLAPICGLGDIDENRARELFERLADEVWLVSRTNDSLRHRPEVRRAMLSLMAKDPEYAAQMTQIHSWAVHWYADNVDPDLRPQAAAEVEQFYHSLMLHSGNDPLSLESSKLFPTNDYQSRLEKFKLLASSLGDAIEELPAGARAQVKVAIGEQIDDSDGVRLPDRAFGEWMKQHGAELVKLDEAKKALWLLETRSPDQRPVHKFDWLAQAYLDTAQWQQYWAEAYKPLDPDRDPDRDPGWPVTRKRHLPVYALSPDPDIGWLVPDPSSLRQRSNAELYSGHYIFLNALFAGDSVFVSSGWDKYHRHLSDFLVEFFDGRKLPPEMVQERIFGVLLTELGVLPLRRRRHWFRELFKALLRSAGIISTRPRPFLRQGSVDQLIRLLSAKSIDGSAQNVSAVHSLRWGLAQAFLDNEMQLPPAPIAMPAVFKPDPAWVRSMLAIAVGRSPEADESAERFIRQLESGDGKDMPSSSNVLTTYAVDCDRVLQGNWQIDFHALAAAPENVAALRSDDPELRPMVRRALSEVVQDYSFKELGAIAAELLPVRVSDLGPNEIAVTGRRRERETLTRLVEYVDRSGVLCAFLGRVRETYPKASLLARVADAVALYDDAYRMTLDSVRKRLELRRGSIA